jgi:hypothetical protein
MSIKQEYKSSNDLEATARVNTDSDGGVLGVCLFLGESDLEGLGIADADHVQYQVENGELRLTGADSE